MGRSPTGRKWQTVRRANPLVDYVVALAALLVQPQPPSRPLPEVVLATHPHGRAHPREAVDHHAQQRPVAEADPRPRVDPVQKRPRLRRRQHRRRTLRHDVLRAPHRRGRVHGQHLVDDEPVAERPDRREVLLHRRHGPRVRPDVGRHVERRDRPQPQASSPRTTPGTAPPPARRRPAFGRWRSRPRRTPGTARRPPAPRPRSPRAARRLRRAARSPAGRQPAPRRGSSALIDRRGPTRVHEPRVSRRATGPRGTPSDLPEVPIGGKRAVRVGHLR